MLNLVKAIFLDRDGVLIEDVHLLTRPDQVQLLPRVVDALSLLRKLGYLLIVVSNQAVVARGMATEADVDAVNQDIQQNISLEGGPDIDAWYFCPHHPNATKPEYRVDCDCRKPKPGMLLKASQEHGISLADSCCIGDRITDILAGMRAGCLTIQVLTGQHTAAPIETKETIDMTTQPDYTCASLLEAAEYLRRKG